jgi:uncharacterized membrane protein YphA (DoxX/SURF4 family)
MNAGTERWPVALRVAFRFAFVYFLLYCIPFPLTWIPYADLAAVPVANFWHTVVPWVAANVLRLAHPITVFENGSGDTTYNWVQVACIFGTATVATTVWSLLDRKRANYELLYRWGRLYLRLWLGAWLITYGADKVIPSQFPPPMLSTLLIPYGEHSPMGLLWTFMGTSASYSIFAGSVEMLAGILLLIPRFTTLGAFICVAAMSNVFMLNMSYDVPVKLFSFHLLVAALILAGPDLTNFATFFVLKRDARLVIDRPFFADRRLNALGLAAQLLFAAFLVGTNLYYSVQAQPTTQQRPPLYGIWTVERANVDWQRVVFDLYDVLAVQLRGGSMQYYAQKTDAARKVIVLSYYHTPSGGMLRFTRTGDGLRLWGRVGKRRVEATLRRVDETKFLLLRRGFHWISEYPFNR